MSEYQYVAFRAIDRPVSGKDLDYMHKQSSRAEVTPWSFENEYHYGDFRGDALEMLRRGYDIHLHYANFGIRKLLIRLPQGLEAAVFTPFLVKDTVEFIKDKNGSGGCLAIEPFYEAGDLEELWEFEELLERLIPLRSEILEGDLRPLYLAHLVAGLDGNHNPDEFLEAPVPAGLGKLSAAQTALAEFYGLSPDVIAAAAQESEPLDGTRKKEPHYEQWISRQPEAMKNAWLCALLNDPSSAVRLEMLAKHGSDLKLPTWPTSPPTRTIAQISEAASALADKAQRRATAKAAQQRATRLAQMAADPQVVLDETERLVAERAYQQIGEMLAELREALSGRGSDLAEKHAKALKSKNPTLRKLTSELRRQGFVLK